MSSRYYFLNLGCPKNQTDGDFVRGTLNGLGFEEKKSPRNVDYIFINTCAFIEQARLETRGEIENLLKIKQNGSKLIALGCYPALPEFKNDAVLVDAAFRFDEIDELVRYITNSPEFCFENENISRVVGDLPYAYLVISEGCDNRCSYCSIPNIRGSYRSREPGRVIKEAEYLANHSVKEIILVAQDTAVYGKDLNLSIDLPGLCEEIAAIDKIEWIRIMYAHPAHLNESMIDDIFTISKVCRYLDMPIQHISDELLTKMNRRYKAGRVKRIINHLRKIDKDISLRTTLMAGFPGETDDDFKKLLDFIEEIEFDYLGAFVYSPEKNTAAFGMSARIDSNLARDRYDLLYDVAEEISYKKAMKQIGKVERMLIDARGSDKRFFEVRSYRQAPEIDGFYRLAAAKNIKPGQLVDAEIMDVRKARVK